MDQCVQKRNGYVRSQRADNPSLGSSGLWRTDWRQPVCCRHETQRPRVFAFHLLTESSLNVSTGGRNLAPYVVVFFRSSSYGVVGRSYSPTYRKPAAIFHKPLG